MSRNYYLPYKPSNPRSIRGAKRRGWHVVNPAKARWTEKYSWTGLCMWAETNSNGYWVANWSTHQFAFENGRDATAFTLMWG